MNWRRKGNKALGQYEFCGTATVSVVCYVEAESKEQAEAMVAAGECSWECEQVDGDVEGIECMNDDEPAPDGDSSEES